MNLRSLIAESRSFILVGYEIVEAETGDNYAFVRVLPPRSLLERIARELVDKWMGSVTVAGWLLPDDVNEVIVERAVPPDTVEAYEYNTVDSLLEPVPYAAVITNVPVPEAAEESRFTLLGKDSNAYPARDLLMWRIGRKGRSLEDVIDAIERITGESIQTREAEAEGGTLFTMEWSNALASWNKGDADISITYVPVTPATAWAAALIRPLRTSNGFLPRYNAGVTITAYPEHREACAASYGGEAWYGARCWRTLREPPFGYSKHPGKHIGVPFLTLPAMFTGIRKSRRYCARVDEYGKCGVYTYYVIEPTKTIAEEQTTSD